MNTEQNFLVRYGLHNFVTCAERDGKNTFSIKPGSSPSLMRHAEFLIKETFGDVMEVQRA